MESKPSAKGLHDMDPGEKYANLWLRPSTRKHLTNPGSHLALSSQPPETWLLKEIKSYDDPSPLSERLEYQPKSNDEVDDDDFIVEEEASGKSKKKAYDPRTAFALEHEEAKLYPSMYNKVLFRGKLVDMVELLNSEEFNDLLRTKTSPLPMPDTPELNVQLKKWQESGVPWLMAVMEAFGGAFLCDSVGLGKTLLALVTAIIVKKQKKLPGYILVVCPKACVSQWAKEANRFNNGWKQRVFVLNEPDVLPETLDKYGIVICSEAFLRTRCFEAEKFRSFSAMQKFCGGNYTEACKRIEPPLKRPYAPLHGGLPGFRISVLIIDEVHRYATESSQLNYAVQSLTYRFCILLTGTFMYNNWEGVSGQMKLLPNGGPFKCIKHFRQILTGQQSFRSEPTPHGSLILNKLLMGLVVGRPPQTIKLPPAKTRIVRFNVANWGRLRLREALLLERGIKLMRSATSKGQSGGIAGISYIARAQMLVNAPIMLQVTEDKAAKHRRVLSSIDAAINERFPKALENDEVGLGSALLDIYYSIGKSGAKVPDIFRMLVRDRTSTAVDEYHGIDSMEHDGSYHGTGESIGREKEESLRDNKYTASLLEADGGYGILPAHAPSTANEGSEEEEPLPHNSITEALSRDNYDLDIFFLGDNKPERIKAPISFSCIPKHGNGSAMTQAVSEEPIRMNRFLEDILIESQRDMAEKYDDSDPGFFQESFEFDLDESCTLQPPASEDDDDLFPQHHKKPGNDQLSEWKQRLQDAEDSKIFSPRSRAIVDTVIHIQKQYPGEKIIIASKYITFLDVIRECLSRDSMTSDTQAFEFSGRSNGDAIDKFAQAPGGSVLLLSVTAGGAGVNIHYASHVLLCEPLWEPGLEEQVVGRALRMPQDRQVWVYKVLSPDLAVDTYVTSRSQSKQKTTNTVRESYIFADGKPPDIIDKIIPSWGNEEIHDASAPGMEIETNATAQPVTVASTLQAETHEDGDVVMEDASSIEAPVTTAPTTVASVAKPMAFDGDDMVMTDALAPLPTGSAGPDPVNNNVSGSSEINSGASPCAAASDNRPNINEQQTAAISARDTSAVSDSAGDTIMMGADVPLTTEAVGTPIPTAESTGAIMRPASASATTDRNNATTAIHANIIGSAATVEVAQIVNEMDASRPSDVAAISVADVEATATHNGRINQSAIDTEAPITSRGADQITSTHEDTIMLDHGDLPLAATETSTAAVANGAAVTVEANFTFEQAIPTVPFDAAPIVVKQDEQSAASSGAGSFAAEAVAVISTGENDRLAIAHDAVHSVPDTSKELGASGASGASGAAGSLTSGSGTTTFWGLSRMRSWFNGS